MVIHTKNTVKCPQCQSNLLIQEEKYFMFIRCSRFPRCHYSREYTEKDPVVLTKQIFEAMQNLPDIVLDETFSDALEKHYESESSMKTG
jgi:ssDNA-binding Zn-finger/Zn-ribbon topoisomerase 1